MDTFDVTLDTDIASTGPTVLAVEADTATEAVHVAANKFAFQRSWLHYSYEQDHDRGAVVVNPRRCEWFALCDNEATSTMPHPILGDVPICARCEEKVEALS